MTARNFNPIMATAAETVVAEVEEIVEAAGLLRRVGQYSGRAPRRQRAGADRCT